VIPCYEQPARITEIERALAASEGFRFMEPIAHGLDPILAVHDAGLVDLLERVWADAVETGATDGVAPLIPRAPSPTSPVMPRRPAEGPERA